MYSNIYTPSSSKFSLRFTIECEGKKKFRVWAEEYEKINSKYCDREIIVEGQRTIIMSFPSAPSKLFLGALNTENRTDDSFKVTLLEGSLTTYNIWLDASTKRFLKLAQDFSKICGYSEGTPKGRLFTTKDQDFAIRYFDIIRDMETGGVINTPARIGHQTGIIEVAKVKFDKYTYAMRMMILLHEYSHKYKNPKIGLKIGNEVGADINALYIYLGLGYSKIDAICVYAKVFLKAQTKGNMERMRKIMDYIQRFENQEFAERN
jgi:hypothetical protein